MRKFLSDIGMTVETEKEKVLESMEIFERFQKRNQTIENIQKIEKREKERRDNFKSKLKEQETLYGFNETEVYHLGEVFYKWLYERLKMWNMVTEADPDLVCDFEADEKSRGIGYELGDTKYATRKDVINAILEKLEFHFKEEIIADAPDTDTDNLCEIAQLWAMIAHEMFID